VRAELARLVTSGSYIRFVVNVPGVVFYRVARMKDFDGVNVFVPRCCFRDFGDHAYRCDRVRKEANGHKEANGNERSATSLDQRC